MRSYRYWGTPIGAPQLIHHEAGMYVVEYLDRIIGLAKTFDDVYSLIDKYITDIKFTRNEFGVTDPIDIRYYMEIDEGHELEDSRCKRIDVAMQVDDKTIHPLRDAFNGLCPTRNFELPEGWNPDAVYRPFLNTDKVIPEMKYTSEDDFEFWVTEVEVFNG